MLHELLAGTHPYWHEDQAEYAKSVRAYKLEPPALVGRMPEPASNAEVSGIIHRCLSPDPKARPTAADIRAALSGRRPRHATAPVAAVKATSRPVAPASKVMGAQLRSARIALVAPGGGALRIAVRTELGKGILRSLGADAQFWDERQCTIQLGADGTWIVIPGQGTVNETLLNGTTLTQPRALSEGDVLAVGRSAKGISKLPLTVQGG
jgi:hypothetical protein